MEGRGAVELVAGDDLRGHVRLVRRRRGNELGVELDLLDAEDLLYQVYGCGLTAVCSAINPDRPYFVRWAPGDDDLCDGFRYL